MSTYGDFEWTPPAVLTALALDEFPWNYYLQTAVHFDGGSVWPVEDAVHDDPPLGPLHVVNAVQPNSDASRIDNAGRMDVLDHELAARGLVTLHVVGASFDGTHREESRAVFGLADDDARALGERFGQVAVFSWRGPWWSLLACTASRCTHRRWQWCPSKK